MFISNVPLLWLQRAEGCLYSADYPNSVIYFIEKPDQPEQSCWTPSSGNTTIMALELIQHTCQLLHKIRLGHLLN